MRFDTRGVCSGAQEAPAAEGSLLDSVHAVCELREGVGCVSHLRDSGPTASGAAAAPRRCADRARHPRSRTRCWPESSLCGSAPSGCSSPGHLRSDRGTHSSGHPRPSRSITDASASKPIADHGRMPLAAYSLRPGTLARGRCTQNATRPYPVRVRPRVRDRVLFVGRVWLRLPGDLSNPSGIGPSCAWCPARRAPTDRKRSA